MKRLSRWASRNPAPARAIIVFAHLFAFLNALFIGLLLHLQGWSTPQTLILGLGVIFTLAYFFYPIRGKTKGGWRHSYVRQKAHDFSLMMSWTLALALATPGIIDQVELRSTVVPAAVTLQVLNEAPPAKQLSKREARKLRKQQKRSLRQQLKVQLKELRKTLRGAKDKGFVKFLLVLLGLGIGLVLAFLVAALSCNIACSGNDGLALFVFLLGITGVVFLTVSIIRAFLGIKRPPRVVEPTA